MKFSVVLSVCLATALSASAQTKPAGAKAPPPKAPAAKTPAAKKTPAAGQQSAVPSPSSASQTTPASGDNRVVLSVGGENITASDFDALIETLPEQVRAQARGPMKRQMAEQIIRVKLLASEARKRGLDKKDGLQTRIRFSTDNLLAAAAFNEFLAGTTVDDAALQQYYAQHRNEYESIRARHILVKFKGSPVPQREGKAELSEEEALAKVQEIRKKLTAGEDFAKLAKEESDDTGSGASGGDLGSFGRGQMVPAFEEVAFKLPVNEVSEPVKTQFGYHLIRVDSHDTKPLDTVKAEIESKIRPEKARQSVELMRKSAAVTIDDSYFGPEGALQVPPPTGTGAAPAPPAPAPQN